jgi:hypothetical protein
MSVPRIGDRLREQRRSAFVGREQELTQLSAALDEDGPVVMFVLGLGGMGKTSLLDAFAVRLEERSVPCLRLDCRAIEPTPAGLLGTLAELVGAPIETPAAAAEQLAEIGPCLALAFDHYEAFRLLDAWLRQELLPALPSTMKVFVFGRTAPVDSWTADPGWSSIVRTLRLGPLDETASRILLERHGIPENARSRLLRFTRGHPLALRLAGQTFESRPDRALDEAESRPAVDVLAPMFLRDVREDSVRCLLEAACLIRRATRSVLAAMVPEALQEETFEALRALPFVETARDGLVVHETVRAAIATALRALDPTRYHRLRSAAWTCLRAEFALAPRAQLWRWTADALYLVDRPQLREAFFPADGASYGVEPARREDGQAIRELASAFDGDAATSVELWWERMPWAFHVVRDPSGRVIAFYNFALAQQTIEFLGDRDPLARRWLAHLHAEGVSLDRPIFFAPRVLAEGTGDAPSPLATACWLDAKRTYLEHPTARRIYVGVAHPEGSLGVLTALGFEAPPELGQAGVGLGTLMLDFGLEGVLGWLARTIDAQFAPVGPWLDVDARALRLGGTIVPLTKLEFGVMQHLQAHPGRVVTRDELLREVWGQSFGGSNVVDALVRTLRKKLGAQGSAVETVIGHGYRFSGFPALTA